MVPTPVTLPSLCGIMGSAPTSQRKSRLGPGLHTSSHHLTVDSCSPTGSPLWDIPEGQWRRESLPVGRALAVLLVVLSAWKEGRSGRSSNHIISFNVISL